MNHSSSMESPLNSAWARHSNGCRAEQGSHNHFSHLPAHNHQQETSWPGHDHSSQRLTHGASSAATFNPYAEPHRQRQDDESSMDTLRRGLRDRDTSRDNGIVTDAPGEQFRLGYIDVVCLILNRMIGSGIFMTPLKVMAGTRSTGASLLLWLAGVVYAFSGMHVYIEFGLNVPRIIFQGVEQSVPRSGGDLHYLMYVYRWIGYRGQTVLLVTCVFGISWIVLGNMAGNCINFAIWVTRAAGREANEGAIRGIALAIATFSCFIHASSRRGGIWLNNLLAAIKLMILLLIIITAVIVGAGGAGVIQAKNVFSDNLRTDKAFDGAANDAHGYASAFLAIIFAFSGFEQPNYVLGEISRPRKRFPLSMIVGTGTVCLLYMATNLAYMAVVPACTQLQGNGASVAEQFFNLTYSHYDLKYNEESCEMIAPESPDATGYRIFATFIAISSLGNVIVMTFTAARIKQETAKQGILPFANFLARDRDVSVGRLLKWFKRKGWFHSILKHKWFSPEQHSEKTPAGALVLHFISCVILLLATLGMKAQNAYTLLTSLAAYVVNAFFGVFLGLGILILRFHGPPPTSPEVPTITWTEMTGPGIKPLLSVTAAVIYLVGNLWPVATMWIPPQSQETCPTNSTATSSTTSTATSSTTSTATCPTTGTATATDASTSSSLAWYVVPTVSWVILAVGGLWFLGFFAYAKRREMKKYEVFTVEKAPEFESANGGEAGTDGDLILVHETVYLAWQAKEIMESEAMEMRKTPAV